MTLGRMLLRYHPLRIWIEPKLSEKGGVVSADVLRQLRNPRDGRKDERLSHLERRYPHRIDNATDPTG